MELIKTERPYTKRTVGQDASVAGDLKMEMTSRKALGLPSAQNG